MKTLDKVFFFSAGIACLIYLSFIQKPQAEVKSSIDMTCGEMQVSMATDRHYIEIAGGPRHYIDRRASIIRGSSVYDGGKFVLSHDLYLSLYGVKNIECKIKDGDL